MKEDHMQVSLSYQLRHELVLACHILVSQKLDSGPFGNVSVRIPETNQYWINPSGVTFNQIKIDDVLRVDLDGNIFDEILDKVVNFFDNFLAQFLTDEMRHYLGL